MIFGVHKVRGWWRWLPVYVSPVFLHNQHPYRTAVGVALGSFGRTAHVISKRRLYG